MQILHNLAATNPRAAFFAQVSLGRRSHDDALSAHFSSCVLTPSSPQALDKAKREKSQGNTI